MWKPPYSISLSKPLFSQQWVNGPLRRGQRQLLDFPQHMGHVKGKYRPKTPPLRACQGLQWGLPNHSLPLLTRHCKLESSSSAIYSLSRGIYDFLCVAWISRSWLQVPQGWDQVSECTGPPQPCHHALHIVTGTIISKSKTHEKDLTSIRVLKGTRAQNICNWAAVH